MKCFIIFCVLLSVLVSTQAKYLKNSYYFKPLFEEENSEEINDQVKYEPVDNEKSVGLFEQKSEQSVGFETQPETKLVISKEKGENHLNFHITAKINLKITDGVIEHDGSYDISKVGQRGLRIRKARHFDQEHSQQTFVWKTIKNRGDLVYDEMILGTYEENTANPHMVHTFFGRLVFNENLKVMAKVLPHETVQFFVTIGQHEQFNNYDFNYNQVIEKDGVNYKLDHLQVLTNPHKLSYKWITSPSGIIPSNAVICSKEIDLIYYCGRMHVLDKGLFPAKINNGVAYAHYYSVRTSTDFEYLVYDNQALKSVE